MKLIISVVLLLSCVCCAQTKQHKSSADVFIEREMRIIDQHRDMLVKMGHMAKDVSTTETVLGRYDWHDDGSGYGGYFGAYSFYQPAFEQAKRSWFIHGEVIEGSNELWVVDGEKIKFDSSVIGHTVSAMNMSWVDPNTHKYMSSWFRAKVIGVREDGRTLILSERAPHHADQYSMSITPPDWKEMCNCVNNFNPPFVDGHPVVFAGKDGSK